MKKLKRYFSTNETNSGIRRLSIWGVVPFVLAGTLAFGGITDVRAQSSSDDADDNIGDSIEEILVTGSRIARGGFDSPSPLILIDAEKIEKSGFTNLDDILQQTPALGAGMGSSASWRNNDGGAAFVNLRGLGTNRSLVLVNGRRRVSGSSLQSAVDLNTIPAMAVESVEIITGGTSAIYGADAVSGVVNIITKSNTEGLEFSVRGGTSDEGGAENFSVGLNGGTSFANDKGNISFGLSYSDQQELLAPERSFSQPNLFIFSNPANTGPNDGIPDRITFDMRFPYITPDVNFFINNTIYVANENGVRPVDLGVEVRPGPFSFQIGGEGATLTDYLHLRMPVETFALHNQVSYEIFDDVNFFAEGDFAKTWSSFNDEFLRYDTRSGFFGGRGPALIQLDNPFIPADLAALMVANGLTEVGARKQSRDELGLRTNFHDRTTFTAVAGLEGTFSNSWQWSAFYQYGEYNDDIQSTNRVIASKYLNAVDAIADPVTGEPICRDAAARADGCIPYNIFNREPFSDELRDYFVHTRVQAIANTQKVYGAQLTGDAFELPAGSVRFAVGLEGREETLETRDDGVILAGEATHSDTQRRLATDASDDVFEVFAEVVVPVLADRPFFEQLDFEAAVRLSDYDTIGSTSAYKAAVNWRIDDNVRLRFTGSRSVRAPSLIELFSPVIATQISFVDPCDSRRIGESPNRAANCAALGIPLPFTESGSFGPVLAGGNPRLTEETSDSFTVGVVFTPESIDGLSISVDYYQIDIDDAVSQFNVNDVAERCVDAATIENPFCDRLTFTSDFNIDTVDVSAINVSELTTSGIDVEAAYQMDLKRGGTLDFELVSTYLIEKEQLVVPDDPTTLIITDGEFTDPTLRLNATVRYANDKFQVSMTNRFIDESVIDAQMNPEEFDIPTVKSRVYTDFAFTYRLFDRTSLSVGINNAFDVEPPATGATFLGGATLEGRGPAVLYDNIGRFIHFGLSSAF